MKFKLTQGPWKPLFEGDFEKHPVEIFTSPDSMILVILHEKKGDKIVGSVVEVYKIFYATGDVDAFVETLPREVILLTKHLENQSLKFFMLGSTPTYIEYDEEKFAKELNTLVKKLQTASSMVKDISKAYHLTLKEIDKSDDTAKHAFFSQPLLVPLLATSSHPPKGEGRRAAHAEVKGGDTANAGAGGEVPDIKGVVGDVILGITRATEPVQEPLVLFNRTIVSGGTHEERMHVMHILAEGSLMSNLATVIVDWDNDFSGLSTPSKDLEGLRKYKVEIEPIGFPIKNFSVPENVKVSLGSADAGGLMELFGTGDNVASKILIKVLSENKLTSLDELKAKINEIKEGGDFNDFQKIKTIRIIRLIALKYSGLFNGPNDVKEISKSWVKGIGRAGIISLKDSGNAQSLMVVQSLVRELLSYYKQQGASNELKSLLLISSAQKIAPLNAGNILMKEIARDLTELPQYGVGVVLGSERETDLDKNIQKKAEAKLAIIHGNDVGVQLKNKKNYRVLIRPGLSACSEK